jgi:hypothetical protein
MPERFRKEFGLEFGAAEQQAAQSARQWLPRLCQRLPGPVRFVGPWHEAEARRRGKRAGLIAQWSNRFWIGEQRLPFG